MCPAAVGAAVGDQVVGGVGAVLTVGDLVAWCCSGANVGEANVGELTAVVVPADKDSASRRQTRAAAVLNILCRLEGGSTGPVGGSIRRRFDDRVW